MDMTGDMKFMRSQKQLQRNAAITGQPGCYILLAVALVQVFGSDANGQELVPVQPPPVLILQEEDMRRDLSELNKPEQPNADSENESEPLPILENPDTSEASHGNGEDQPSADDAWKAAAEQMPEPLDTITHRDIVSFRNGDFLAGQLEYWDIPSQTIRWAYPDSVNSFTMQPGSVEKIILEPRPRQGIPDLTSQTLWRFFLTSGEILDGRLIEISEDVLSIQSGLLGHTRIPRPFIEAIYPNFSNTEALYRGPDSMNGWTRGDVRLEEGDGGQWRYNKGAFYATEAASIARDVDLTPLSSIEIEAAWKGSLNFAIALYTDYLQPIRLADKENEPDFGPFYSLQIGSQSARLQSINKEDPIRQLGYAFIPTLNQKTQAKFTILSDARTATVTLLVDDQRVHTWRDTQGFFGKGEAIRVVHQGMGSIRIGSLVVRQWNGIIDSSNDRQVRYRTDVVQTSDGVIWKGLITSMKDNVMRMILNNSSDKELPLETIHSVHFQSTDWKLPSKVEENARLTFYTDETIRAALFRVDGAGILFEHAIFGKQLLTNPATLQSIHSMANPFEPFGE